MSDIHKIKNIKDANIRVYKYRREWRIDVDGVVYAPARMANMLGISKKVMQESLCRRKENKTAPASWLRRRIWLKQQGQKPSAEVYSRGDEWYTCNMVSEKTGCSASVSYNRLVKWVDGEKTTKELLAPVDKECQRLANKTRVSGVRNRKEECRSRKERQMRLAAIPSPTEIEKRLWGRV
jgi:hypothetical protein